jgi:hypothetical protein
MGHALGGDRSGPPVTPNSNRSVAVPVLNGADRLLPSHGVIRSIAIVPQPPLLVPELVGAAAAEVEPLRTACRDVVGRLPRTHWYAVGVDGIGPVSVPPGVRGTFRGYGVDVPVSLGTSRAVAPAALPLALLVAGWLSMHAGVDTVAGEVLHPATDPTDCLARGKELADELHQDQRMDCAVLVLADGARTHAIPGAGRVDERAAGFDAAIAAALSTADVEALAGLDPRLATALGAQGRAAWQVLAGIAIGSAADWAGELLYSAAPYGVGYHVALWEAR